MPIQSKERRFKVGMPALARQTGVNANALTAARPVIPAHRLAFVLHPPNFRVWYAHRFHQVLHSLRTVEGNAVLTPPGYMREKLLQLTVKTKANLGHKTLPADNSGQKALGRNRLPRTLRIALLQVLTRRTQGTRSVYSPLQALFEVPKHCNPPTGAFCHHAGNYPKPPFYPVL